MVYTIIANNMYRFWLIVLLVFGVVIIEHCCTFQHERRLTGASIPDSEFNALYELYNATDGPNWQCCNTNMIRWNFTNQSVNPCTENWEGIECVFPPPYDFYYVSILYLSNNSLVGTLPSSLDQFSRATVFNFEVNQLEGTLPSTIGSLTDLESLHCYSNRLNGSIPSTLANITGLLQLDLSSNLLSKTIPSSLGQLSQLALLNLEFNMLSGSIPNSLANLSLIESLSLSNNHLNGTLPPYIGYLTLLEELILNNNSFSSLLPDSLGGLGKVSDLSLSINLFSGSIPVSFCNLTSLAFYNVADNSFTGQLPLCANFSKLIEFDCSSNNFTGSLPSYIGNLTALDYLILEDNSFTGTLPSSLFSTSLSLIQLEISYNRFNFLLPTYLGGLTSLVLLSVGSNSVHGTIPSSIGSCLKLTALYMYYNMLSGAMPPSITNITSLKEFDAGDNFLTGNIPASIGKLSSMFNFAVDTNSLTGTIPSGIGDAASIVSCQLYLNSLTGTIPDSIGNIVHLQAFTVEANLLTGTIPYTIGKWLELLSLDLSTNLLTGSVPSLSNCSLLTQIFLANNILSGSLDGVFNATSQPALRYIIVNNNQLVGTISDYIFLLENLTTFMVANNCFHGTLPSTVCSNSNLVSLIMDGSSSATSCRVQILPGLSSSYMLKNAVSGTIPSCLFEFPHITTLHLSGNAFTGTLPEPNYLNPYFGDLSLSHNFLKGGIPTQFQDRIWLSLDLSYNRLSNVLFSNFASVLPNSLWQLDNVTISLENNRLSGIIPGSLQNLVNISMLGSNMFSCGWNQDEIPKHDSDSSNYECGSNDFDVAYVTWLVLVLMPLLLLFVMVYWRDKISKYIDITDMSTRCQIWLSFTDPASLDIRTSLVDIGKMFHKVCVMTLWCGCYIAFILLPLYIAFGYSYGNYEHAYSFSLSAAFMTGVMPSAFEFAFWLFMVGAILWNGNYFLVTWTSPMAYVKYYHYVEVSRSNEIIICAVVFFINVTAVSGVNLLYLYSAIFNSSKYLILVQFLMAAFKFIWSQFFMSWVLHFVGGWVSPAIVNNKHFEGRFASLQVCISIINSIVIPIFVVMVVSPNCFYYVFIAPPVVTSYFVLQACAVFESGNGEVSCIEEIPSEYSVSYDPPFTYSYQCSSSVITYYAPAIAALCIISSVVAPMIKLLLAYFVRRAPAGTVSYRLLCTITPVILKPLPTEDNLEISELTYFKSNQFFILLCTNMAFLLTFGVVFPPLAFALCLTILVTVYGARLELGHYVSLALEGKMMKVVEIVESDCQVSISVVRNVMWMFVVVACLFYSFFLFDTMGGAVGLYSSYWILIVVPLIPLVLYAMFCAVLPKPLASMEEQTGDVSAIANDKSRSLSVARPSVVEFVAMNSSLGDRGRSSTGGGVEHLPHSDDAGATLNVLLQKDG